MKRKNWTPENLRTEALKCKTKGELRQKHPTARIAAKRFCIWKEITSHMPDTASKGRKVPAKYSYEAIKAEALKYESRGKFQRLSRGHYRAADNRGFLEEVCSHMEYVHYPWTDEELAEEAKKYKTRSEFQDKNASAYNASLKREISDKICSHMEYLHHYWTNEELAEEALKYKTKSEFKNNNPSAYGTAHKRKISDKICKHMPKEARRHGADNPAFKWTHEKLKAEALKYKTRSEFQKNSKGAYQSAFSKHVLDEICSHMEILHQSWSEERLVQEALRYKTRGEFQNESHNAYMSACRKGILDKICPHMEYVCYPWTDEELAEEALKYETRGQFQKNSPNTYQAARSRKILNKICPHMKTLSGSSTQEIELCNIIKSIYPKAHTLRKRSKKSEILIKGKPHIHGFEIDIYVPELNCGIEFDGTYWHSFDRMRKSKKRKLWPDEDIKNYHEIKDSYFLSKGIKILHIKEEDWDKNKQACIDKCLEFLRTRNG
jgi:hypothetical protein